MTHLEKRTAQLQARLDARKSTLPGSCVYLGPDTRETVTCPTCRGRVELKLFECAVLGCCTLVKAAPGVACCNGNVDPQTNLYSPCLHRQERSEGHEKLLKAAAQTSETSPTPAPHSASLIWAYGVTTVLERRDDLLPRTLASLKVGGFDAPRLFVDGCAGGREWERFGLEMTFRSPKIRTHGNWVLTLSEIFIRNPQAQRYAIFQDDFVTSRNLRVYLETSYPDGKDGRERGYLNLYTMPSNQSIIPTEGQTGRQRHGWHLSNQFGRGAVALVFNREAVLALLTSEHMVGRPMDANRGHKAVDGGIVDSMRKAGWREYVHNPSLVQHTGEVSSMGNKPHKQATSFRGEDFDLLEIYREGQRELAKAP